MAAMMPQKRMNREIARSPGVRGYVYATAQRGAGVASGILAAHRDTGHSEIVVKQGKVDSFVVLEDAGGHALAIERGHWVQTKEGPKFVDGVHALSRAFR